MRKLCIISLGRLGQKLYQNLKDEDYDLSGSYNNSSKGIKGEFAYDFSQPKIPEQIMQADTIVFNLTPSIIETSLKFKSFISKLNTKRFIFISSTSVYGEQEKVTESTSPIPQTKNGKLLYECEEIVTKSFSNYAIIRPAGIYSEKSHPGRYLSGKENIKGRLHPVNLISLSELSDSIKKILIEDRIITLNCVNTNHPKKEQYYTNYCKLNSIPAPSYNEEDESIGKQVDTAHLDFRVNSKLD